MKPKLTFEQLYEKLMEKGISFNYHNKSEAIEIMKNRNYYYRLASYRKNYEVSNGKYIDLDFKELTEIASLDSYLREFLLQMCLDVEHLSKTKIMNLITLNSQEDGYSIIHTYENNHTSQYDNIVRNMHFSNYKKSLTKKRKNNISIWVFLEFAGLKETEDLLSLYNSRYRNKTVKTLYQHLKFVRNIRNNCAHNNTFLINLFDNTSIIQRPSQQVRKMAEELEIEQHWLYYMKVHDLVVLFYLHKLLSSTELRNRRKKNGINLLAKFQQKEILSNIIIEGYFKILSNLLASLDDVV